MRHRQTRERALSTAQPREQMTTLLKTVSVAHPGADIQPIERASVRGGRTGASWPAAQVW